MVQLKDCYDDQYVYFHLHCIFPFQKIPRIVKYSIMPFAFLKDDDGLFLE